MKEKYKPVIKKESKWEKKRGMKADRKLKNAGLYERKKEVTKSRKDRTEKERKGSKVKKDNNLGTKKKK
jgi:hypothetical protein